MKEGAEKDEFKVIARCGAGIGVGRLGGDGGCRR